MAYAHTAFAPPHAFQSASPVSRGPSRSLISRLFHAFSDAQMRRMDQEIARYLESTGGRFTDSTEREIERRYLANLVR